MRALVLAVALVGCGGPPDAVRDTLSVTASAVDAADQGFANYYTRTSDVCRVDSESWDEYDACVASANTAADAVVDARQSAREGILAAESLADSWGDAAEGQWPGVAACLADALARLNNVLDAAGVDARSPIAAAIGVIAQFGGECANP